MDRPTAETTSAELTCIEPTLQGTSELPSQVPASDGHDNGNSPLNLERAQVPADGHTDAVDASDILPAWPKSSSQKRVASNASSKFEANSATRPYLQTQSKASFAIPKTPKRKGQRTLQLLLDCLYCDQPSALLRDNGRLPKKDSRSTARKVVRSHCHCQRWHCNLQALEKGLNDLFVQSAQEPGS